MSDLNVTVQISQHLNRVAFRYPINTTVLYSIKAILSQKSFYILRCSTVCVCGYHISSALCHCSTVLFWCTVKAAFSLLGVSVKGKHSLYVIKHVIKDTCSKTSLKVSLMSAVGLLVGPGVFIKVSSVTGMPVLAVDVKVLENVIKVEAERLGTLSMSAFCFPSEVCRGVTKLVIFPSSGFIR